MGDGFLLEFASAVDGVECAVEIQGRVAEMSGETKAAQCIELRIGINVGDIMVEDGDVFGDGVNIASSNSPATPARRCRISKRSCAWTRTTASARLRSQIKVFAICYLTISARRFPPRRRLYGFIRETSGLGNDWSLH